MRILPGALSGIRPRRRNGRGFALGRLAGRGHVTVPSERRGHASADLNEGAHGGSLLPACKGRRPPEPRARDGPAAAAVAEGRPLPERRVGAGAREPARAPGGATVPTASPAPPPTPRSNSRPALSPSSRRRGRRASSTGGSGTAEATTRRPSCARVLFAAYAYRWILPRDDRPGADWPGASPLDRQLLGSVGEHWLPDDGDVPLRGWMRERGLLDARNPAHR
jgi:hypothetical protein